MWKIVTEDHFLNQNLKFPAARTSVARMVHNALDIPAVKLIKVFESSVTLSFSPVSDIDIFVVQDDGEHYLLAKGCARGADYRIRQECDDSLLKDIKAHGVPYI